MKVDIKEIASILGIAEAHIPMLVGAFLEEANGILDKLSAGIESKNYEEISLHAHSIKGSAANLRLEEIAEIAKGLELAGKAQDSTFDYQSGYLKLKEFISSIEL